MVSAFVAVTVLSYTSIEKQAIAKNTRIPSNG